MSPALHPSNNFDALRLVGALMVMVGHAFQLTGRVGETPYLGGVILQSVGVYIFFSVSGYLITASWLRTRDVWTYGTARVLRIFPGLLLVVATTVLVIGPLATTRPLGTYWVDPASWRYLLNGALYEVVGLPGVFDHNPVRGFVNGSVWTLPMEFACYLAVPLLLVFRRRIVGATAISMVLALCVYVTLLPRREVRYLVYGQPLYPATVFWTFFAAGALIFLIHHRWPGFVNGWAGLALGVGYLVVGPHLRPHTPSWAWVALPYAVIAFGLASTPVLRRVSRFGDLSYGIYLWAYPVQQLVVMRWGAVPVAVNLALAVPCVLLLSWLSWHLVEHRSLLWAKRLTSARLRRRRAARPADSIPA